MSPQSLLLLRMADQRVQVSHLRLVKDVHIQFESVIGLTNYAEQDGRRAASFDLE